MVAQAEGEIVTRYGYLDDGERASAAAMFDPPAGAFVVARRVVPPDRPSAGSGVRALRPGLGEIRRLWVDPEAGARRRPGA